MAPTYAGVLGPLAFATAIARGVLTGSGLVGTMQVACVGLFLFAAIGYVVGRVAEWTVTQSCEWQFANRPPESSETQQ